MSTAQIGNLTYYKQQNTIFSPISCSNDYEISSSLPEEYQTTEENPHIIYYNDFVQPAAISQSVATTSEFKTSFREFYLDCYSELIDLYSRSGTGSVYFRDSVLTGSSAGAGTLTGLELYKNMNYHEILDIEELKEGIVNNITSNPCFLMDINNLNAPINPLKLEMMKGNFRLLCRTLILYTKLQNLFISSVFDNTEFYTSGDYKDSTFIDYCFEILMNKINTLIPKYKKSIFAFMNQELETKLNSGSEIVDPITNEKIEFSTPVSDTNMEENITKYAKVMFKTEFLFITQKSNIFFSQQGTDNGISFSIAPSSSFGVKLLSAKEFFLDSIPVYGLTTTLGTYDIQYTTYKSLADNKLPSSIKFHLLVEGVRVENGYDLSLSLVNYTSLLTFPITKVTKFYRSEERDSESLTRFAKSKLTELKILLLEDSNFLLFSNYLFPLNKILNIASIVHVNLMLKTYQTMYNILDGSVATISNIHDIILGNEDKLDCETPDSTTNNTDQNNIILGINLEIAKAIATFPISILKAIEETYDPNIFIASKIRAAAESLGAPKLPIIPYSLGLLPALTIPPPVGVGPPLIPPWGYIYWGVDAAEIVLEYAKNGVQTGNIQPLFPPISKNPTKPDC